MASIFQGNRIREHRALKFLGRPLVYGIGTIDPAKHLIALQAHDFVFTLSLTDRQKERLTPKWMGTVVKAMMVRDRGKWKDVLSEHLLALEEGSKVERPATPPQGQLSRPGVTIAEAIAAYNRAQAHDHYGPYFPGFATSPELVTALLDRLLLNASIRTENKRHSRSPEYLALLSETKDKTLLNKNFAAIQELARSGTVWEAFFKTKQIEAMEEVDQSHGKAFIAWRKGVRFHKKNGRPLSGNILKKELTYFRNVCRYCAQKRFLQFNPMEGIGISKMEAQYSSSGLQNYPLSIAEVHALLIKARARMEGYRDASRACAAKLNLYSIIFLFCTGCRPQEAGQFSVTTNFIQFHRRSTQGSIGGKTKHAARRISLSPTLRHLLSDDTLAGNRNSQVSTRLSQFIKRLGLVHLNPYRIRHTVCSLLFAIGDLSPTEIAYRMGHHSPDFSYRVYGEMDAYLGEGYTKEQLRIFWHWVNHEYFA